MNSITDWEQCYREGTTPWDRGEPSPPLKAWMESHGVAGRVIVPGCGMGHDVALLVRAGADVVGLDISATAIAGAKAAYPEMEERFVLGDLFDVPIDMVGSFDVVVEHTCLSGMPPSLRPRYVEACRQLLKPDGRIVGVWFIEPEMDPGESGPPYALPLDELERMFENDFEIVEDFVPLDAFPGREGRERFRVLKRIH